MVNGNLAYQLIQEEVQEIDYTYRPEPIVHTSVSLSEIFGNRTRLDASAFSLESKDYKQKIATSKYGYVNLWSKRGLVKDASYPGRFKRIYTTKKDGVPFFLPSQLTELKPQAQKHISVKTYKTLNDVEIEPNTLLMTRSGSIGKCTISSRTNTGKVYSDDVIRITFKDEFDLGYVYTFFQTSEGLNILQTNNYGAVIQHIEPEHLQNVIIPNAPEKLKQQIHELIKESFDLRDTSNELIDKAEAILYKELQLKPIEELEINYFDSSIDELKNFTTKLSSLDCRFDGSYHIPIVQKVEQEIRRHSKRIVKLNSLTKSIILPGRFSRTYVDKSNGVQFLGGRDLFQLNPTTEKHLSKTVHKKQIEGDLQINQNDILTPSRGTIGNVVLAPKHFDTKVISDNIINISPVKKDIAGYLFCFLNSDYGTVLIKRQIYGGVVDAMEPAMLANINIPILKNESKQKEINDLVLQANELRYNAYLKEQEAIKLMQNIIDSKL